ncbi:MAG: 23S rRNA (guanosine(2251)-2'-O)-methyltransferase RlmB [Chlorobi bacterium]|nr:23S rRNA (guanosine(2251)-2'-O)-methyltransferase RlmB [Chlorobiota bacterium]
MKVAGIHGVTELLASGRPVQQVWVKEGGRSPRLEGLVSRLREAGVPVKYVPRQKLDKLYGGVHQGVVAETSPVEWVPLEELADRAFAAKDKPVFVLLDGVTDARNLGAILRTAWAFDADGVIMPAHRAAPVNEDTVRTSAGAVFHVPLVKVNHLADAIYYLQSLGAEAVAATGKAALPLEMYRFTRPVALIMGDEHKGISRKVEQAADTRLKITMNPAVDSLNVSVAAAVFLYEIHKQFMSSNA